MEQKKESQNKCIVLVGSVEEVFSLMFSKYLPVDVAAHSAVSETKLVQ